MDKTERRGGYRPPPGAGAFADVFAARSRADGVMYAVKQVFKPWVLLVRGSKNEGKRPCALPGLCNCDGAEMWASVVTSVAVKSGNAYVKQQRASVGRGVVITALGYIVA